MRGQNSSERAFDLQSLAAGCSEIKQPIAPLLQNENILS
jgi:hypothetical protein